MIYARRCPRAIPSTCGGRSVPTSTAISSAWVTRARRDRKSVEQLLEEAGSELSHIVKTNTYITDPRFREPVYREVGRWLQGVFPVSTGLVVAGLAQPDWLMEIDVIAVIPGEEDPS